MDSHNEQFPNLPVTEEKSVLKINEESPLQREKCPPIKKLETIFSDSFEELETIMIANENEKSILATTLMDNTIVDFTKYTESDKENDDKNDSMINIVSQETLNDLVELINSIIEKNNQSVIFYKKQMEDLQRRIDDTNVQTEKITNMKQRLMKNFNLNNKNNKPNDYLKKEKNDFKTFQSPQIHSKTIQNLNSCVPISTGDQIIEEMRSTIKFMKTPRMSRASRSSVMLTPHSMSFCIKNQYEKLLE